MNRLLAKLKVVHKIWLMAGIALFSLILAETAFLVSLKDNRKE